MTTSQIERVLRAMARNRQSASSVHQAAVVLSGALYPAHVSGVFRANPMAGLILPNETPSTAHGDARSALSHLASEIRGIAPGGVVSAGVRCVSSSRYLCVEAVGVCVCGDACTGFELQEMVSSRPG